jgi:hypothetical protein
LINERRRLRKHRRDTDRGRLARAYVSAFDGADQDEIVDRQARAEASGVPASFTFVAYAKNSGAATTPLSFSASASCINEKVKEKS